MKTLKDLISEYEYYTNGFQRLSGCDVQVFNVRIRKDKYIADVVLWTDDGAIKTRYNNCEYPKDTFKNEPNKV